MTFPQRKNFSRADIAAACRQYGASIGPLPAGVEGAQLLWALSGVESSFGANCQPRHEPAFDVGGAYATHAPMPMLLGKFGAAGACSYGPWQLMLCNAPQLGVAYRPETFDILGAVALASQLFLNGLLRRFKPQSLAEIGECYNAGHICPDPVYVERITAAYALPMPEAAQ